MIVPVYYVGEVLQYLGSDSYVTVIDVDNHILTLKHNLTGFTTRQSDYHVAHFYRKITPLEKLL